MDYYAYTNQFDANISNNPIETNYYNPAQPPINNFNPTQPPMNNFNINDPRIYNQNYTNTYDNTQTFDNTQTYNNYDNTLVYNNYNTSQPPPAFEYDLNLPASDFATKTDDELWIETWLSKKGKIQINLDSSIITTNNTHIPKVSPRNVIQIHSAKEMLRKSLIAMEKLESIQETLKENLNTMSCNEWKKRSTDIGALRDELSISMTVFQNPETLRLLKMNVNKRFKKRLRQKRCKIEKREIRAKADEERKLMHQELDLWLENMKDSVERAKGEENMKKDADCVLAEVTKKKSDARKEISLINALLKLRNARENLALQRGENTSHADQSAFNNASEKLAKMWDNSLKIYSKEEQGLRIMLEETVIENKNVSNSNKEKRIAQEWEVVLFGSRHVPNTPIYWGLTSAERDFETFVAIRKSWDTFLTNDSDIGTKIPIGWVIPDTNSSSNWTKYLKNV